MTRRLILLALILAPLGFYPMLRDTGTSDPLDTPDNGNVKEYSYVINARLPMMPSLRPLSPDEKLARYCLHSFAVFPGQPFPSNLAFGPLEVLCKDKADNLEDLAKHDPLAFLEKCAKEYENKVEGYRLIFVKQERVAGNLHAKEKIRVHFREKPFSVHMHWLEGTARAIRTLWVDGENKNMLVVRSSIKVPFLGYTVPLQYRSLDDAEVQSTSRFPVTEFGIDKGAQSTVNAMRAAKKRDKLFVRYEGMESVPQLGDRLCYKLVRTPYDPPEADGGINEYTIFIDAETLLHTGSVLKDSDGKLLAEYFFRDVELNPKFDAKQFTENAL